jgi:phosphohistidine phosphatase
MRDRRLVLIRHAKAEAMGSSDSARKLAARGRHDAPAIGRWLAKHNIEPDLVVVSPAKRTRETWELAVTELGATPPSTVDRRVYENTLEDLLAVIQEADSDVTTLVIVGHNPAMEGMAFMLDDGSGPASRQEMAGKFPTSGIAVLSVHFEWADVGPGRATLEDFAAPRG